MTGLFSCPCIKQGQNNKCAASDKYEGPPASAELFTAINKPALNVLLSTFRIIFLIQVYWAQLRQDSHLDNMGV